jgi:hypothetical protein
VAEKLQVSRKIVGLSFLRKLQLCAGATKLRIWPVRNIIRTGRNNFQKREEVPAYKEWAGIYGSRRYIIKS